MTAQRIHELSSEVLAVDARLEELEGEISLLRARRSGCLAEMRLLTGLGPPTPRFKAAVNGKKVQFMDRQRVHLVVLKDRKWVNLCHFSSDVSRTVLDIKDLDRDKVVPCGACAKKCRLGTDQHVALMEMLDHLAVECVIQWRRTMWGPNTSILSPERLKTGAVLRLKPGIMNSGTMVRTAVKENPWGDNTIYRLNCGRPEKWARNGDGFLLKTYRPDVFFPPP